MPVSVEVRHPRIERGSVLRLGRQGRGCELPASVEEHLVVERSRLETLRRLECPAEDLGERGVGIRRIGARPEPHRRQRGQETPERRQGSDPTQPVVVLGLDHVHTTRGGEIPVIEKERVRGVDVVPRVATPARRDDVQPAIPVQIPRRHAVPPTHPAVQSPLGGRVAEAPVVVQKEFERPPFRRDDQVGPAVAIHVREHRCRHETDRVKQLGIALVQHQAPGLVAEQARRLRLGIRTGRYPPSHE